MPEVLSSSGSALAVGDKVQVQYTSQSSYLATIIELDDAKGLAKVHWDDYKRSDDEWRKGTDCTKIMEASRPRRGHAAPPPPPPPPVPRPVADAKPKAKRPRTEVDADADADAAGKAARKVADAAKKTADEAARAKAAAAELERALEAQAARASSTHSVASGGAGAFVPALSTVLPAPAPATGTAARGSAAAAAAGASKPAAKPSKAASDAPAAAVAGASTLTSSSQSAADTTVVAPRVRSSGAKPSAAAAAAAGAAPAPAAPVAAGSAVPASPVASAMALDAREPAEVILVDRRSTVRSDASISIIIGLAWEAAGREVGSNSLSRLLSAPAPATALANQVKEKVLIQSLDAADAADAADATAAAAAIAAVKAPGGADDASVAAASQRLLTASPGAWLWSPGDQLLQRASVTRTRDLYSSASTHGTGVDALAGAGASGVASSSHSSSSGSSGSGGAGSIDADADVDVDVDGETMYSPLLSLLSLATIHECTAAARSGVQLSADVTAAARAAAAARWSSVLCSLIPVAASFGDPHSFTGSVAAAAAGSSSSSGAGGAGSAGSSGSGGVNGVLFPLDAALELRDEAATAAAATAAAGGAGGKFAAGGGGAAAGKPAKRGGPQASSASSSSSSASSSNSQLLGQHRDAARRLRDTLALCAVLLRLHAEVAAGVAAAGTWRPAHGPAPEPAAIARVLECGRCALPSAATALKKRAEALASDIGAPLHTSAAAAAAASGARASAGAGTGAASSAGSSTALATLPSAAANRDFVRAMVDRLSPAHAEATVPRISAVLASLDAAAAAATGAGGGVVADASDAGGARSGSAGRPFSPSASPSASSSSSSWAADRISPATRALMRIAFRLPIALSCAHSASRAVTCLRAADDVARAAVIKANSAATELLNKHSGGRARGAAALSVPSSAASASAYSSALDCDWLAVTAEAANEAVKAWLLPALRDTANTHRRLVLERVEARPDVITARAAAAAAAASVGGSVGGSVLGKRARADEDPTDDGGAADGGAADHDAVAGSLVLRGPLLPGESKLLAKLRAAASTSASIASVTASAGGAAAALLSGAAAGGSSPPRFGR